MSNLEQFAKPERQPDILGPKVQIWVDEKLMTCQDSNYAYKYLYVGGLGDESRKNVDETIEFLLSLTDSKSINAFAKDIEAINNYLIEKELLGETDSKDI